MLLELERAFGWPFFDPDEGRRPAAVAAPVLVLRPSRGLHHLPAGGRHGLDDRPDHGAHAARRLPADRRALIATGFFSFGLWVHHMFTTGIPALSLGFFSAASMAVAMPSGIQVFAWIATIAPGRLRCDARRCSCSASCSSSRSAA